MIKIQTGIVGKSSSNHSFEGEREARKWLESYDLDELKVSAVMRGERVDVPEPPYHISTATRAFIKTG